MISRVTHLGMQRSTLANLQSNLSAAATLQAQLSSGKKITVASDDPAGSVDLLRLRAEQSRNTQYTRNADNGASWLATTDTALQTASSTLTTVRDRVIQGGNSTLSDSAREALATEIEGLRDGLLSAANATYAGRSVFAGTSDAGTAFDATTYDWTGSTGASVQRQISDTTAVQVDTDGSTVFGSGSSSVFAFLDGIATTLRAGGDPTSQIATLDGWRTKVTTQLTDVGARTNRLEAGQTALSDAKLALKTQVSGIEDIDMAETILQLQAQEVVYKGALAAGAQVLQPSLVDYLS